MYALYTMYVVSYKCRLEDIIPFTCQENEPWHCYWVSVKEANWGENVVQFRIISTTGMACAVHAHSVDLLHYSLILNL